MSDKPPEGGVSLPMVGNGGGGAPPPPKSNDPPATRLLGTLGVAGALAGLLLVLVNQWSEPRILAYRAAVLEAAIHEVLSGPEHYETLFVVDGQFTADLPAGADSADLEQVYVGFDSGGATIGLAIPGGKPGFQDVILLIFGFDPTEGRLLGMKVLESKETPGLGDKIEKDSSFVGAFAGALTPLRGLRAGSGTGDPREIDMITGATISSRTVIAIINERLDELAAPLRTFAGSAWAAGRPERAPETGDTGAGPPAGRGGP